MSSGITIAPYDENKNQRNIEKHGISLDDSSRFDWSHALTEEDNRKDYGEMRYRSLGLIDDRLHVLVWTHRNGNPRIISLRKANARERNYYDQYNHV
jgi:uncharacterized DUF497 family protein